jgi:hypothetical protein
MQVGDVDGLCEPSALEVSSDMRYPHLVPLELVQPTGSPTPRHSFNPLQ